MRFEDIDGIRALPLFRDCADASFTALLERAFLQRFPPGLVLVQDEDPADFLHVVVEGMVEMVTAHGGRETTLGFVRPFGTFIIAAVLMDQAHLQTARTLERSRILMVPAQAVREIMRTDPGFMTAVTAELAGDYRRTVKELKSQKLRTGVERLANWLLRHAHEASVQIPVEKRTLAARLGMTPENLSRAFATLGPHGVEVQGPKVLLHDRPALEKLAKPSPLIDDFST